MKLKKIITLLALLAVAIPTAVLASSSGDKIENGQTVEDDLTIYNDMTIEESAVVNGDITLMGGELEMEGTVNGDILVFGGDVELTGNVFGELVVFGGDIEIHPDAIISGECALFGGTVDRTDICLNPISADFSFASLNDFLTAGGPNVPAAPSAPFPPSESGGFFSALMGMAFTALIVGTIGYFVTSAVPSRMYEVRSAVKHNPYIAGGIGMLTAIAGSSFLILTSWIWIPVLVVLSLVCGIGVFLGFAGLFYLGAVVLMGWITVGALAAGRFVDQSSPLNPNDPLVAGIGTGAVTLLLGMLAIAFPVITSIIVSALFFVGLGGVVLTRIGKQSYPKFPDDMDRGKFDKVMQTLPVD